MESAKIRAERGAALLDEWEPGWDALIDLSILDLDDGCRCILGQVYDREVGLLSGDLRPENGYEFGVEWLADYMGDDNAVAHGFASDGDTFSEAQADTWQLDEAWIAIIERRRADR